MKIYRNMPQHMVEQGAELIQLKMREPKTGDAPALGRIRSWIRRYALKEGLSVSRQAKWFRQHLA